MSEFPPSDAIHVADACSLIERVGVDSVEVHPACDEIKLKDGRVLKCWEGGYEYGRYWTIWPETNAAVINAERSRAE